MNNIKVQKIIDEAYIISTDNDKTSFYDVDMTTEMNDDLASFLGIIKGDIYSVCKDIFDRIIIIYKYDEECITDSLDIIKDYIDSHIYTSTPIFMVIGCDYPDVYKVIGRFAELGFQTADQLVDLGNNYVMVKTTYNEYKKLNKQYVMNQLMM